MAAAATSQTLIVFAYGSNMLSDRIRERCPSATALGMAELSGYELRWHKRSRDGSGKCDVVPVGDASKVVYGVLYEITVGNKGALDRAEGLGQGYEERQVEVVCGGHRRAASIYYATEIDPSLKPSSQYKAFVVAGAKEHNLPGAYVERLMATETMQDPTDLSVTNRQLLAAKPEPDIIDEAAL